MPTLVRAVFPGTFDPITLGHEDMLRRACALFGEVIVAVAMAHHKKTLFTLDERLSITRQALADMPKVRVEPFVLNPGQNESAADRVPIIAPAPHGPLNSDCIQASSAFVIPLGNGARRRGAPRLTGFALASQVRPFHRCTGRGGIQTGGGQLPGGRLSATLLAPVATGSA